MIRKALQLVMQSRYDSNPSVRLSGEIFMFMPFKKVILGVPQGGGYPQTIQNISLLNVY